MSETKGGLSVDEAKVDGLCDVALALIHLIWRHAENFRGRGPMHILPLAKGLQQRLVATHVGHNAQLHLRIIGAHQLAAPARDEGVTNTSAGIRLHRDVLQVGIRAGKPTRGCHGLVEARMHAAVGLPEAWEHIHVGGLELRKLTVTQNPGGHVVEQREFLQDFNVGGKTRFCFLHRGQPQLVEEHHGELLG